MKFVYLVLLCILASMTIVDSRTSRRSRSGKMLVSKGFFNKLIKAAKKGVKLLAKVGKKVIKGGAKFIAKHKGVIKGIAKVALKGAEMLAAAPAAEAPAAAEPAAAEPAAAADAPAAARRRRHH